MTPRWEAHHPVDEDEGPLFMDAHLTPNRSLSKRGFALLLAVAIGLNVLIAIFCLLQKAWPVVGFLGLDILLLVWAFRTSYRDGRASETVRVAPDRLQLTRTSAKGVRQHWQVHPAWARVETTCTCVVVSAGSSRLPVAAFLSPPERDSFSRALQAALHRARAYRPSTSDRE